MTRPLVEYLSEYEYSCVSVHKAVVMFDELRKTTGEKKFFAGLKKYYADCKFKRVKSEDLVGAFERIGVDVFGFFDGFLGGKDGF
jgi:aminopeptidase N